MVHTKIKPNRRPIGIDLFSGAGGMSLGFEQAGFDIAAAVDVDPVHCAVHKFNFPRAAVLAQSVHALPADHIRRAAAIQNRPVDCVFGGAPCQGFSLIGHRAMDDPRNGLVRDFVRLVAELKAKTFVFENVKGLTVGKHKTFLVELVKTFEDAGYSVRMPWRVLNAGHYGTPQSRERLIVLGARRGVAVPEYPEPTTDIAGSRNSLVGMPIGPTCGQALADVPDADGFNGLLHKDETRTTAFGKPSAYAKEMRCLSSDAWHFGYVRNWDRSMLTSSIRTGHTEISRRRFAQTAPGTVEPISRFFRLPEDGVSNTLRAGTDGSRGAFTSPRPIHYRYPRCITVREMARLHGFPDWFRLHATKWHGARQIGNAVPPPLARAIAAEVMEAVGAVPSRPDCAVNLGDPNLLRLDTSRAARYFGVKPLKNRRDRKSGAKKRKQIDIEAERLAAAVRYG